ncbi:MAG: hypothetical protein MHPSP_000056 [Paramarteilia canceri]
MRESPNSIKSLVGPQAEKASSIAYRKRTKFSHSQLKILEVNFTESTYVSGERLETLAENLGLATKNIKIWFQNRRDRQKRFETGSVNKVNSAISQVVNEIYHQVPMSFKNDCYSYYPVNMFDNRQLPRMITYDTNHGPYKRY